MSLAYRPDVDGLRAVAVASAILFHCNIPPFTGGFIGIEIFFVISGFLITAILARDIEAGRFSLVDFYDRRVRRIFPALFVMLVVVTLLAAFVLMPSQMVAYSKALFASAFFYANIHFAGDVGYFSDTAHATPLLNIWSLALEEQFYIIFPLLLFALLRFTTRRITIVALVALTLASLVYSQIEVKVRPEHSYYLLSSRGWELLVGALVALLPWPRLGGRAVTFVGIAGLLAIVVPIFVYSKDMAFPGIAALPPVLGTAAIIIAGANGAGVVWRLLSQRAVVYVGRISYPLYLWHWPLLVLAALWKGSHLTYLQSAGIILLSIGLAALSLKYVETPFRSAKSFGGRRGARIGAGATAMALTVVVAVGFTHRGAGVWRNTGLGAMAEAAEGNWNRFQIPCNNAYSEWSGALKHMPECTVGSQAAVGKYDVLVWGDSHAGSAFPGLAASVERAGLTARLLTMDGCPPLVGGEALRFRLSGDGRKCVEFNTAVLDEIRRTRPKLVIMVGRWSMWTRFGGPVWTLVSDEVANGRARTQENSRRVFAHMLERTLATLDDMGMKALVLGQVPEFPFIPPTCVARSEFFKRDTARCLSMDAANAMSLVGEGNTMVQEAVKRHPHTQVFVPVDIYCRDGRCPASDGGQFYYVDHNHLSAAGAQLLQESADLRAALADALRHDPVSSAALNAEVPAGGGKNR